MIISRMEMINSTMIMTQDYYLIAQIILFFFLHSMGGILFKITLNKMEYVWYMGCVYTQRDNKRHLYYFYLM